MAHKHAQKKEGNPVLEQLYNALMLEIEPELMTDMVPELEEIYAGETDEERKERGDRYAAAFELFAERFSKILDLWKEELHKFKEKALAEFQKKSTKEDAKHMADIERSIDEQ